MAKAGDLPGFVAVIPSATGSRLAAILVIASLLPLPASAADYATCILDRLPGVQNDAAATAAYQLCTSKYPGGLEAVKQGSGRGLLGYDSGAECTLTKAADTRSNRAAYMIGAACRKLYDEPGPWDNFELVPYNGPVLPLEPSPK